MYCCRLIEEECFGMGDFPGSVKTDSGVNFGKVKAAMQKVCSND